jgi:hypothetical protein
MKRGRISAAELSVIPIAPARERVRSPSNLSAKERQLFDKLLETCGHFQPSDFPLLISFVQASLLAQQHRNPKSADEARIWHTAIKAQGTLATKLRLCPNTRIDRKTATRKAAAYRPSFYETMDLEDANNARDD